MSAIVIPFAMKPRDESGGKRFSKDFFDSMSGSLKTCIGGTVVFALLSLIAEPLLNSYQFKIEAESKLYNDSRIKAAEYAEKEQWITASHFISVMERIWKGNPALGELYMMIDNGVQNYRYARGTVGSSVQKQNNFVGIPGQKQPVNADEALSLGQKAFNEKRFYDANWFASLAMNLAPRGSIEQQRAQRLQSLSWNSISSLAPLPREEEQYKLYRRKREGYEALVSDDWIRAYYIFNELKAELPQDPDVQKYFTMSEDGLKSVAFFIDEMNLAIGSVQSNTVFSLPSNVYSAGGRFSLRIKQLISFEDCAYGRGLELFAFDGNKTELFRMEADLIKIIPVQTGGDWHTMILTHAVDREDSASEQKAKWEVPGVGGASVYPSNQLYLDLVYEDFLLATTAATSTKLFFAGNLFRASAKLKTFGFIPEVFYVEIMRTIYIPILFLPLGIFALIIGWKYRPRRKVPYAIFPMMLVLPFVFETIVLIVKKIFNLISIWTTLAFGFQASCLISIGTAVFLFLLMLFLLAAQRGGEQR
jgi:hypothetical protein